MSFYLISPNDEMAPQKYIPFSNLFEGVLLNDDAVGSSASAQTPSFFCFERVIMCIFH